MTGAFFWRVNRGPARVGQAAGTWHVKGHRQIRVDRGLYMAHQLAWLIHHGEWPGTQVDHANLDKTDNRIDNLRLATNAQNRANSRARVDNKSGFKGVIKKGRASWAARIRAKGQLVHIGTYPTPEAAHKAYCQFAQEIHGEFARGA